MTPSLRDGLVAEYLFAGNADDTSGGGRHAVVHGATLTADRFRRPAQAFHFDGLDDYIEVAPPPALSADVLTVSVWARFAERDFEGWTDCIVAQDDGNDDDQSRRVFQLSTFAGHVVWHRMVGARDPMCKHRVRPGRWQHVVAVHEQGVNRLYVDGVLHDTVEHRLWTHATQPLHIGRKGTPEPFFFFKGDIDDVRIYARVLSGDEIAALLVEDGWQPPLREANAGGGDPLSGAWGQQGVVLLDLIFDGERRVTGQIMAGRPDNMALITDGTFERATGAIRLQGQARDPRNGRPVHWTIEGTMDDGEITVIARFGGYQGNFILTRAGTRLRWTRRSMRSHLGAASFRIRRRFRRR